MRRRVAEGMARDNIKKQNFKSTRSDGFQVEFCMSDWDDSDTLSSYIYIYTYIYMCVCVKVELCLQLIVCN